VFKVNFKMVKVLLRIHNAIRFGGGFFVGFFRARIIGEFTQINPLVSESCLAMDLNC